MNRFNYVGPAAQAISTFSAITSFTEGNRAQARAQKQTKDFNRDKVLLEEANEVAASTRGNVQPEDYIKKNKAELSSNIDRYAKMYGESNAEAGYKLNEGMRTEKGENTKANAIWDYAQKSVDTYNAKSRNPQLKVSSFPGTSTLDLSTIRNEKQEDTGWQDQ